MQIINVKEIEAGMRLDLMLSTHITSHTRSFIKILIDEKLVMVNGKVVKAGYKLKAGDQICYTLPEPAPTVPQPQDLPIDIVYQDAHMLVINKEQGVVVHPGTKNHENTLVNALLFHVASLSDTNGPLRPGIVHRLDKDTSGLMLVAKTNAAHEFLSEQLANRSCKRYYKAIVDHAFKDNDGEIITYIGRSNKNRLKMAVQETGRQAHTKYKLLQNFENHALVECELITGRTHQIRVHMAHINHAIVGDELYNTKPGKIKTNGQLLHSYKITFTHPHTKKTMTFTSPLPQSFQNVLNILEKQSFA